MREPGNSYVYNQLPTEDVQACNVLVVSQNWEPKMIGVLLKMIELSDYLGVTPILRNHRIQHGWKTPQFG